MNNVKFYQASTSELFGETYGKTIFLKNQNFIQNHLTVLQNYMLTGLLLYIENHMEFLHATEFYLIMRVHEEVRRL